MSCPSYLPYPSVVLQGKPDGLLMGQLARRVKQHLQQDSGLGAEAFKALGRHENRLFLCFLQQQCLAIQMVQTTMDRRQSQGFRV